MCCWRDCRPNPSSLAGCVCALERADSFCSRLSVCLQSSGPVGTSVWDCEENGGSVCCWGGGLALHFVSPASCAHCTPHRCEAAGSCGGPGSLENAVVEGRETLPSPVHGAVSSSFRAPSHCPSTPHPRAPTRPSDSQPRGLWVGGKGSLALS